MSDQLSHVVPTRRRSTNKSKPQIQTNDRQLCDVSADCLQALLKANDPPVLFIRAGEIVRVAADENEHKRIVSVSASYLCGSLSRVANFFNIYGQGKRVPANPPGSAVADLLARSSEWGLGLPPLVAISEVPLLRADGSVVLEPGYDPALRVVYCPSAGLTIPPIPPRPTVRDAELAVLTIEEAIAEFPWDDYPSRANCFALLVTPIIRGLIDGCVPLALLDANRAGSGKGLIAEVLARIHTGCAAPVGTAPESNDEAEWRKRITGIVRDGNSLAILDNIETTLKSANLAAAITGRTWTDRVLGKSQTITLPQRVVFVATGNNLVLGGDLPRRCFRIRLDAKMSRPWERTFRHSNLTGWVLENRGTLLAALLCMASAWFAAGCPAPATPSIGGFQEWAEVVGGILAYAGVEGFLENREDVYATDPAETQWHGFLTRIRSVFGDSSFTIKQLLKIEPMGIGPLSDAFPDDLEQARSKGNVRSIGHAFLRRIGTRFGDEGLHLVRAGEHRTGVSAWRVEVGS